MIKKFGSKKSTIAIKNREGISVFAKILIAIVVCVAVVIFVQLKNSKLLSGNQLFYIISSIIFLLLLIGFLVTRRHFAWKSLAVILSVILIGVSFLASSALNSGLGFIKDISVSEEEAVTVKTDEAFNIYISGIDTYGDINTVSRSDVNIIATVNITQKKLLLTSVPRDSYVAIALGGQNQMDKLTHAGNYGIDSSVKTLENLLETEIPAYLKVNFSSFVGLIDTIGGVTVNNPVAFEAYDGTFFKAGDVSLNGQQALAFSRERKNISGGDISRGQNQQRVIEAVFRKMISPKILTNFQSVFQVMGRSIKTNLSYDSILEMINKQMNSGSGDWEIKSITISGRGQTGGLTSYAMPNHQLYMYILDKDSLREAKDTVKEYLGK